MTGNLAISRSHGLYGAVAIAVAWIILSSAIGATVVTYTTAPQFVDKAAFRAADSSYDKATANDAQSQNACGDFDFSFLHSQCVVRPKHRVRKHRLATFTFDHPSASR